MGKAGVRWLLLTRSFRFLPRIGEKTERRLWTRGVRSWSAYRDAARVRRVTPPLKARHEKLLAVAEEALDDDPAFFARHLPSDEQWRAFGDYGEDAVYLDIETTGYGSGPDTLTVVGAKHGDGPTRMLVKGQDLTPESVTELMAPARVIVTFNGQGFDVPALQEFGATVPDVPHFDLRPGLTRLGYRGGLKKIEVVFGLERAPGVAGLTGWDAVKLWRRHRRGDATALPLLLAYNQADVENMVPLARFGYARLADATFGAACRAGGPPALQVPLGAEARSPTETEAPLPAGRP